ncbi:hypothetical protein GCM10009555_035650 [Acrocarpospora macrocephala]
MEEGRFAAVAGVDGMRAGVEAVEWAAHEAVLRDVPLRVVSAVPAWCPGFRSGGGARIISRTFAAKPPFLEGWV